MWLSTNLESGSYNESSGLWTLNTSRHFYGEAGRLQCRHLIFATGAGCHTPVVPHWANRDSFPGKVVHSVDYHDSDSWKGLRGVVIGAGNTGHDVASDMVEAGLSSVTMVQRSPTCELLSGLPNDWQDIKAAMMFEKLMAPATVVLPVENMMKRYAGMYSPLPKSTPNGLLLPPRLFHTLLIILKVYTTI